MIKDEQWTSFVEDITERTKTTPAFVMMAGEIERDYGFEHPFAMEMNDRVEAGSLEFAFDFLGAQRPDGDPPQVLFYREGMSLDAAKALVSGSD